MMFVFASADAAVKTERDYLTAEVKKEENVCTNSLLPLPQLQ